MWEDERGREGGRAKKAKEHTCIGCITYLSPSLFLAYKQATAAVVNHRRGGTTTTTTNITLSFTFYSIMLIRFARIFQSQCFVRACSESSASTNQNTRLILSLSLSHLLHLHTNSTTRACFICFDATFQHNKNKNKKNNNCNRRY